MANTGYCTNCGEKAASLTARFCQRCGSELRGNSSASESGSAVNEENVQVEVSQTFPKTTQQLPQSREKMVEDRGRLVRAVLHHPYWTFVTVSAIIIGLFLLNESSLRTFTPTAAKAPNPEQQRALEVQRKQEAEAFKNLSPADHFRIAKLSLDPGASPENIGTGLRHLSAIPDEAVEAASGRSLKTKLLRQQHLALAQQLI